MLNITTTIDSLDELRAAWSKITPEQISELIDQDLISKIIAGEIRIQFSGNTSSGTAEGQVITRCRVSRENEFEAVYAKPKRVLEVSSKLVREFLYKVMMENIDVIVEEYGGLPEFNINEE